MMDLDNFKEFNQRYGESFGNEALKKYADILTKLLYRKTDIICRVAGDEYSIILPQTDLNQAIKLANLINQTSSRVTSLTYSMGLATATASSQSGEIQDIVNRRLYEAKQQGKNRLKVR